MMPMAYRRVIVAVALVADSACLALGGGGSSKEERPIDLPGGDRLL